MAYLDASEWDSGRCQQLGWQYNFQFGVVRCLPLPNHVIPELLALVVSRIERVTGCPRVAQVIICDQRPGGGISTHIDYLPAFGSHVTALSLMGWCTYIVYLAYGVHGDPVRVFIPPRLLVVMKDDAQ